MNSENPSSVSHEASDRKVLDADAHEGASVASARDAANAASAKEPDDGPFRSWPYARETWLPKGFGMDSIQGLLEIAEWLPQAHMRLLVQRSELDDPYATFGMLKKLEEQGLVGTKWLDYEDPKLIELHRVWLTAAGYEKLKDLRNESKSGKWRRRIASTAWIVLTSILTTLVTLQVKSCTGST